MKGRALDMALILTWIAAWIIVAIVHPGLANLLIAWFGAVGLLYYNSLIRHRFKDDSLRTLWQRDAEAV